MISRSPIQFFLLVLLVLVTLTNANILDVVLEIFDAPSRVDTFAQAPGHYAEHTVEFLAFGDAAMDYYQS